MKKYIVYYHNKAGDSFKVEVDAWDEYDARLTAQAEYEDIYCITSITKKIC